MLANLSPVRIAEAPAGRVSWPNVSCPDNCKLSDIPVGFCLVLQQDQRCGRPRGGEVPLASHVHLSGQWTELVGLIPNYDGLFTHSSRLNRSRCSGLSPQILPAVYLLQTCSSSRAPRLWHGSWGSTNGVDTHQHPRTRSKPPTALNLWLGISHMLRYIAAL